MRGKANEFLESLDSGRITPAYAGKSGCSCCVCRVQQDHPRLCGEKFHFRYSSPAVLGSPPPMRGKADCSKSSTSIMRITPAYAGKSCRSSEACKPVKDHPRLCGEKGLYPTRLMASTGSPPPMRGKVNFVQSQAEADRITPAYAGKSPPEFPCRG